MAKRRAKKTVKKAAASSPARNENGNDLKDTQIEDKEAAILIRDVERRSGAVRAMRDVEIEHSLTALRLLRSYFTEEQLQTPVLQFFKENLPNLSILKNKESGQCEVQWNDRFENLSMNHGDERDINASLLRRLSMVHPNCSNIPLFAGIDLPSEVKTNLFGADNLQFRDFLMEGPPDYQMPGMHDGLRTPGVSSQRLSIGMTPKTLRVPKPGEMLLSVHGSPLGVYKDDNMEAIHESEEG
ncbi:Translation initiation factor IF-2 putative isoform 2 [Tripterygium wilfordii]|uniref:Translation initiation factor IF-2 putative isoform 2 n=1 Tax=Tripterygium wilfordii TaxID=458696 RepID=A0A7J7DU99_TRIWF|nr:uncharacterized protein LOC119995171 [Tripterygium wilfordii]KAF5749940.1 Translation initiation factor IF-2 putative isoform 2 [Tripterygium wilfordii]